MSGAKKSTAADLQRKIALVTTMIAGRAVASSSSLSRSFGLPVDQVRRILAAQGVRDDG